MVLRKTVRLFFEGRFLVGSFADFVERRAARLDVEVVVRKAESRLFSIDVTGQPDLIDAFEMACSLGPLDCLVLECWSAARFAAEMEKSER